MSLLTMVQNACDRIGLVRPSIVVGSSDSQVRRLLALSNQDGKALAKRHDWQELITEKTFSATATTTQTNAIPTDFDRMVTASFWNRTANKRVVGPLSPQRWQQLQAGIIVMAFDCFRIRGSDLLMSPTPTAGHSMAYEYVSKYWCGGAADTSPDQEAWVADSDISFLDEELMTIGLVWRFKKSAGLDYGEDFTDYEARLASLMGNDGGQTDIDMTPGEGQETFAPHINDGSWSIT